MREKNTKLLLSCTAFLFLCMLACVVCVASARTIYVPDDYERIQWAVDNASAGDTIIVRPGTYTENVDVDKSVEIHSYSQNPADTIVKANNSNDHVFYVTADNVYISGFTVTGATGYEKAGIYLHNSNNSRIENVNASNNFDGIELYYSNNDILANNTISSNIWYGIYLYDSSYDTIVNNTVSDVILIYHAKHCTIRNCTVNAVFGIELRYSSYCNMVNNTINAINHGITIYDSNNNNIIGNTINGTPRWTLNELSSASNNTIKDNIFINTGISVWDSYQNTVENNTINEKPLVYLENVSDYFVTYAGQVVAVNCNNITVIGLDISNTSFGVEFWKTNNSDIIDNTISWCFYGIYIAYSNDIDINNNIIERNWDGIDIYLSNNNEIKANDVVNNEGWGIRLSESNNNDIVENKVENSKQEGGIWIGYNSNNNTLEGNKIRNNEEEGIWLYSSDNNTITHNSIINNTYGIFLYYSDDNFLYLNNFINNVDGNVYSKDSTNIWSSTEPMTYTYNGKTYTNYLGNYWSDHECEDANGDGICDSPYVINSDNQDNYPLVKPFENYQIQEKWSFAIITDLHIGHYVDEDYGWEGLTEIPGYEQEYFLTKRLREVVDWINNNHKKYNIKFVIVLGDISDSGEYSEFKKAREILDNLDIPYIPVIGNHDIWSYIEGTVFEKPYENYFSLVFGDILNNLSKNPEFNLKAQFNEVLKNEVLNPHEVFWNYNFTYNGVKFIVLDWVSRYIDPTKGQPVAWAAVTEETLDHLRNSLREARENGERVLLISHHPIKTGIAEFKFGTQLIAKTIHEAGYDDVLVFAGHTHGHDHTFLEFLPGIKDKYMDANTEYVQIVNVSVFYPERLETVSITSVTTESLIVGLNEEKEKGVKGLIRIVNVTDTFEYDPYKAEFERLALNPYLNWEPELPRPNLPVTFIAEAFTKIPNLNCTLNFTPDGINKSWKWNHPDYIRKEVVVFNEEGNYEIIFNVCSSTHCEEVSYTINVSYDNPEPKKVKVPREIYVRSKQTLSNLSEIAQNAYTLAIITKEILELISSSSILSSNHEVPIGEIGIHFENTTEDINLTNLIADTNITQRKSILYMSEWPEVVERSKVLYIPYTGKGAVYVCRNATNLEEVTFENSDFIIRIGEEKEGMFLSLVYFNDTPYYALYNVTGTGAGEIDFSIWHVDDDFKDYPNADFSSIQQAVNAANSSDWIIVHNGTYEENIIVNKSLNIRSYSQNPADTIVKANNSNDHVFYVTADNVYISGFTVTGADDAAGIYLYSSNNSRIENVNASNNEDGIYLSHSSNNTIVNNTVSNNDDGISLFSNNNTIANNTVSNNVCGIYLCESSSNIIANNTVSNNDYGIWLDYSNNNTIANNNVSSNNHYGIDLYDSSNNTIYLNNLINNTYQVSSSSSTNIWNSTEKITYTYKGKTYENYLGNYWDDYNGSDANGDGIGETPYIIDSDKDNYPLIERFENYFMSKKVQIFDTGRPENPYPSISGKFIGTIKANKKIIATKLYTYACEGTGGHTEHAIICNKTWCAYAEWKGYKGDWMNISFNKTVILMPYETYNITIVTGSYPQIHHTSSLKTENGWINCTEFIDANGKKYNDWIPAIKLWFSV